MMRLRVAKRLLVFLVVMPVLAPVQARGAVVINEILASSHSLTLDPDYRQFADWIEVYNSGNTAIDLGGSYLTDDFSAPTKWQIPMGTTLPANGYLLFWSDGLNDGLHTNFKLNNNGEAVGLFAANGSVIDTLSFGKQVSDVSLGRDPQNPNRFFYYEQPTPEKSNSTAGKISSQQAGKVEISALSGFYSGALNVTLSAPNVTIRFTRDGSTPVRTSEEYTSPLKLTATTVLKARAFTPELLPGPVETRTFFINEQTTQLVFSLTTDPDFLWDEEIGIYVNENIDDRKSWERPAVAEFFETDGDLTFTEEVDIRLFGRTAIYIPQKSLSLFFSNKLDCPLFSDIVVHEFDSIILRSSSDDWHLTMFRDAFIQKMIRDNMSVDTQAYRPAVLFINGEYWGIHNIREKYNESYVATHHGTDPSNIDMLYIDERQQDIEVLAGDRQHYDAMVEFSENNNLSLQANFEILAGMVDINNLIDYVIAEAYIGNNSWAHNIRAWRPRTADGIWQWMVFDLDRGFRDASFNALEQMAERMHPFCDLLANDNFKEQFINRFVEYINDAFAPAKVAALLDSLQSDIAAEMPNHIDRWQGYCGNGVCGMTAINDWQDNVAHMRSIVNSRPATVRQQLMDLFDLNSTAQLDIMVQQPGYGEVKLGQQTTITDNYSGQFFRNTTVPLRAEPHDGFQFVGWQQTLQSTTTLLNRGANWKYFDKGSFPGAGWTSAGFNDSNWAAGPAQLGYGENDEDTVVDFGPDSNNKYVTTYFRSSFRITDISNVQSLNFKIIRDDGAVVYLNGREMFRTNMPGGTIQYDTWAGSSIGGDDEDTFFEYTVDADALIHGENIVAVEVHQNDGSSSDISFDLQIDALTTDGNGGLFSENPELTLQMSNSRALTALFSPETKNELPAQIKQNMTLTAGNSPYLAFQDVVVQANVTLTMEKGAEIRLASDASLIVYGRFIANGTADSPAILRGINNRWGALCFEKTTGVSTLSFVTINGATTGPDAAHFKAALSMWDSDVTLDFVRIENVNQPVYGNGGAIVFTNSTLDGTASGDDIVNIQYASARVENCYLLGNGELDFDSVNNGIIRNNRIDIISTNSNRDGIDVGASDNVLIENNRIFNCPDKGISVGEHSLDTIIRGNLVVNAAMGVAVKDDSYALIDFNTFYDDSLGVACYEKVAGQGGGHAVVRNSIFAGSFDSEYSIDDKSSIQITYSLSDKSLMNGLGNIKNNPRFVDVTADNFYLQADSPCIDAGDPASPNDADGTRADIGAFYFSRGPVNTANLFINEFLADNSKTLVDNAGQYDDWIEIYNGSTSAINIGGLYLTDDFSNPTLWRIPSDLPDSTTIAPGGFLILWTDEDLSQGLLHANFKLNATSEQLALVKKISGQTIFVDSIRFSTQQTDISRGRRYDGATSWRDFLVPTPGSKNDPTFTPVAERLAILPTHFAVHQNFPNPFNPTTTIVYELPVAAQVTIELFNALGQRVSLLVRERKEAGIHRIEWSGLDDAGHHVSSGLYFYHVSAGEFSSVHKMMFMQ